MIERCKALMLREQVPETLMWLGYAVIVLTLVPFHEPWRDEAQTWLIARDLKFTDMIMQMRYEGTPAFWHTLLYPFAQAGASFAAQQWLHALIAVSATGIFIFKSPFQRWQKFAFIFSFFIVFEYAIVSRSYVLSILFLWIIASLYPKRFERPLTYALAIFLLMNTNSLGTSIGLTLAGIVGLESLLGKRLNFRILVAGMILIAGAISWAWQSILADDHFTNFLNNGSTEAVVKMLKNAFFPDENAPATVPFAAVGIAVALSVLWVVRRRWQMIVLILLPLLAWVGLHLTQWAGGYRHWGFGMLICVFTLWITKSEQLTGDEATVDVEESNTSPRSSQSCEDTTWYQRSQGLGGILLFSSLLLSTVQGARVIKRDFSEPFSASAAMAEHIQSANYSEPIAAIPGTACSALLPHLPGRRFWYFEPRDFGTYIVWNTDLLTDDKTALLQLKQRDILERLDEEFGDDPVLLLTIYKLVPPDDEGWLLLHQETVDHWTSLWSGILESYYLYRRKPPIVNKQPQ